MFRGCWDKQTPRDKKTETGHKKTNCGAPNCGASKGGAPKGGAPKGGHPKISRFFVPLPHHFRSFCLSLCVFSWFFSGVWKQEVSVLGLRHVHSLRPCADVFVPILSPLVKHYLLNLFLDVGQHQVDVSCLLNPIFLFTSFLSRLQFFSCFEHFFDKASESIGPHVTYRVVLVRPNPQLTPETNP